MIGHGVLNGCSLGQEQLDIAIPYVLAVSLRNSPLSFTARRERNQCVAVWTPICVLLYLDALRSDLTRNIYRYVTKN